MVCWRSDVLTSHKIKFSSGTAALWLFGYPQRARWWILCLFSYFTSSVLKWTGLLTKPKYHWVPKPCWLAMPLGTDLANIVPQICSPHLESRAEISLQCWGEAGNWDTGGHGWISATAGSLCTPIPKFTAPASFFKTGTAKGEFWEKFIDIKLPCIPVACHKTKWCFFRVGRLFYLVGLG